MTQCSDPDQATSLAPVDEVGQSRRIHGTVVRRAREGDEDQIARLANMAGGDTLSFILKGIDPTADTLQIYRAMISETSGIFALRNCLIAERDGRVGGVANAFPGRMIASELQNIRLTEREEFLRPRTALNDPYSYLLNNIAVAPEHRRRGVGSLLLEAVILEARQNGLPCVTLHVWADNAHAIAFYRRFGFQIGGRAMIPWHRDLPHVGGSLLLRLDLQAGKSVHQHHTNHAHGDETDIR